MMKRSKARFWCGLINLHGKWLARTTRENCASKALKAILAKRKDTLLVRWHCWNDLEEQLAYNWTIEALLSQAEALYRAGSKR